MRKLAFDARLPALLHWNTFAALEGGLYPMADQAKIAAELLQLEQKYQAGTLSDGEDRRWGELTTQLFSPKGYGHMRRSFRLPCDFGATIHVEGKNVSCRLVGLSHLGLTLGLKEIPPSIRKGISVVVTQIDVPGDQAPFNLICQVARVGQSAKRPELGLRIFAGNRPDVRSRYFDRVYYPAYVRYLEALSKKEKIEA